nr:reverse transcriptase domain-containing protein [Tanacetum cinerariifolium]
RRVRDLEIQHEIRQIRKRIRELELQRKLTKETESEPIIWDIGDEEEEYPFVNKYPSLQEPSMLVEEESCPVYDTDNEKESEVIYNTDGNDVDDSLKFELLYPDQGKSLVIQRVLSVAPSKSINYDSWRRNNIFRTKYNSKDKVCNMINDEGSCENAVSIYMVEKLALKTVDHPEPYQFTWLKKRNAIKVNQGSRSNHYDEGKIDAGDTNVDATSKRDKVQAEEQQELNDEKKAKLFMQLLEKRKKFFTTKRAEENRNKPPTHAQQRKIMCTYLKNMERKKLTNLKNKSFDSIQEMFDRAFKRVNTFVDYRTELVEESSKKAEEKVTEGSSKRAGTELEQESVKKQKIDDDKETTELKQLVNIIPDEEGVAIDAIPLAVKPPSIVDWKIQKEGKKSYYKIIRADGSLKIYLIFSHMLKYFKREDVETLWKLVNAKYGSTRPEGDYKRVLWGDLKVMLNHILKMKSGRRNKDTK